MSFWDNGGSLLETARSRLKKINRTQWITLFLVGLLLGVIAVPTEKKTGSDNRVGNAAREEIQEQGNASALEQRLQQVLSGVEGVGKVQVMLMTGNEKTYVIAEKVGYAEPNYFSYVFKKQFGMSPSKYKAERLEQK